ncbi:Sieve element occlusion, N-terminal [Trema orientale]|uniref:Sieve element occlusion, N-terminal n=1 Tax=Trema orientale TaxID=63057 RepID=A0A2P5BX33_TREOI|nr:Sieve element occlusion, N-terminal [Trema orientale]
MPNPSESKKVNPFNLSDKEIIDIIYEYHGEPDGSFDEDSLFIIVRNILTRSTQIVDEVMLPLSCCKALVAETAHDTTVEILKKLKEYKWQAKAVMTLASFAMEFGDFSLLVDLDHSKKQDQLTRSLGILKGASSLISATTPDLLSQKQRRDEVVKLNELIKKTLEVMKIIIAIEERASYDPSAMSEIPTSAYVYWIINTVTACATKIAILTSNEGVALEALYSLYDGKVEGIKRKVAKDLEHFLQVEEEHKRFTELLQLSSDPKRVTEFLKSLLLTRDSKDTKIIDASDDISYKTVEINAVTEKKRLLIILSRPEISEADIDIIRPIQIEKIKEEKLDKDYGIVWMPIAEEKRQEYENAQKDFGGWVKSTKKIQWYSTARFVSEAPVIHFLKEKWYFKSDPIVVVLNVALGIVENLNAFYTIRLWRLDAFPYDEETEKNKFNEMTWVHTLFKDSTDFSPKWVRSRYHYQNFISMLL